MPSFSAKLRVDGHSYPIQKCSYQVSQATNARGQVSKRVRYSPVEILLDVPENSFLSGWAADASKRQTVDVLFLDPKGGEVIESLHLAAAYCIGYREFFAAGDKNIGAYQCQIMLSDPDGFTLHKGDPSLDFSSPSCARPR